jgi:hypothetical protein
MLKRLENREERHPFFCNIFFIFFFPFVCHRGALKGDNIPVCQKSDRSEVVIIPLRKKWREAFVKYRTSLKHNVKAKKPNLLILTIRALSSFKLLVAFLSILMGFL